MRSIDKKLWIDLAVLAVLVPLGILIPHLFNAEGAWGEWGTDTLQKLLGYVPEGLKGTADLWKAPVPDYNFGPENASLARQSGSYIVSAFIGIALAVAIIYVLSKVLIRKK